MALAWRCGVELLVPIIRRGRVGRLLRVSARSYNLPLGNCAGSASGGANGCSSCLRAPILHVALTRRSPRASLQHLTRPLERTSHVLTATRATFACSDFPIFKDPDLPQGHSAYPTDPASIHLSNFINLCLEYGEQKRSCTRKMRGTTFALRHHISCIPRESLHHILHRRWST